MCVVFFSSLLCFLVFDRRKDIPFISFWMEGGGGGPEIYIIYNPMHLKKKKIGCISAMGMILLLSVWC